MDPRGSVSDLVEGTPNDCYYYRVKSERDAYSQMDILGDAVNLGVKYDLLKRVTSELFGAKEVFGKKNG